MIAPPPAALTRRGLAALALSTGAAVWFGGHQAALAGGKRKRPRAGVARRQAASDEDWTDLWNGQDLDGWGLTLLPGGTVEASQVFSVGQDGKRPVIVISGEAPGLLTAPGEHGDCQIRVEWKWGVRRFAPRSHLKRTSGMFALASDAPGADAPYGDAVELQLQEGDTGDLHLHGAMHLDIAARRERFMGQPLYVYAESQDAIAFPQPGVAPRVVKGADYERPWGDWNTADILLLGGDVILRVNGAVTATGSQARLVDGSGVATDVTRGRLRFESQGAELFLRRVAVRKLTDLPHRPKRRRA